MAQTSEPPKERSRRGGVAHEVNNALAVIGTLTELLLDGRDDDDPERTDLEEIRAAADRAAAAMKRLSGDAASEPPLTDSAGPGPSVTVLLIDPDSETRGFHRRALVRAGAVVLDASGTGEADSLLRAGTPIDLILWGEGVQSPDDRIGSGVPAHSVKELLEGGDRWTTDPTLHRLSDALRRPGGDR